MEQNIHIDFDSEVFRCQLMHRDTASASDCVSGSFRSEEHGLYPESDGNSGYHYCGREIPMALIKHIVQGLGYNLFSNSIQFYHQ